MSGKQVSSDKGRKMSKRYDTKNMMILSSKTLADNGFSVNADYAIAEKRVNINGVSTLVEINATSSGLYGLKVGNEKRIYKNNLFALLTMAPK
jgi:hypothetical protein